METRILVIRHGQSEANIKKFFAGQSNIQLTELGVQQAEMAANLLKDEHIDTVYSSSLDRAFYTALPFARDRNLEVVRVDELMERNCGHWTSKPFEEVERLYAEERWLWNNDPINLTIDGGESSFEMIERFGNALDKIAKENEGKTVLVASHGGVIKSIPYYYAKEKSDALFNETPIATNCSITEILYSDSTKKVIRYADDSYLGEFKTGAFII